MAAARARLDDQARGMREEYEASSALLCVLERIASAESEVVQVLCAAADAASGQLPSTTTSNNSTNNSTAITTTNGSINNRVGRVGSGVAGIPAPSRTVAFQR